jgi:hypothetical protein
VNEVLVELQHRPSTGVRDHGLRAGAPG